MRTYVNDPELTFARADQRPDGFRPLAREVAVSTAWLLAWAALGTALLLLGLPTRPWAVDHQAAALSVFLASGVFAGVAYGFGLRHLDYLFALAGGLHRRRVMARLEAAERGLTPVRFEGED